MIYLFLANGFEEMEALTPLDMLRRVGVEVKTVGITGKMVMGSHQISVVADVLQEDVDFSEMEGVILPGGMPGTLNLEKSSVVQKAIEHCFETKKLIAAICAAPSILGHKRILKDKNVTCFPGFEKECEDATVLTDKVVVDGNIITAKGAGCALAFGSAIVAYLKGEQTSLKLLQDMQV